MAPLSKDEQRAAAAVADTWPLRAPADYLERIDWSRPEDPIRRQVIPSPAELSPDEREQADPIGDERHSPVPRLVHRYPQRVLLMPTEDCPVHCRFCFRRARLSARPALFSREALAPALNYLRRHQEVREVILTGGDPLLLSAGDLDWLRGSLEALPHLRLLRVHTRIPVVAPALLTPERVRALDGRLPVWVVTHFNHPNEIVPSVEQACGRLRDGGFALLNQSVLLRGVNDDVETLVELCHRLLYDHSIRPYYLHHCDLAPGTAHFRLSLREGAALHEQLRGRLSGLALPRYVVDLPGGYGKVSGEGPGLIEHDDGTWKAKDWQGTRRNYEEVLSSTPERRPTKPSPRG